MIALERISEVKAVRPEPLGSVVIPAHDEAPVIGRCLHALFAGGTAFMVVGGRRDEHTEAEMGRAACDGPVGDGVSWTAGPWPPSSEERVEVDDEINSNGDSHRDEPPIDLFPDGDREAGHLSRGRGMQRLPDDDA